MADVAVEEKVVLTDEQIPEHLVAATGRLTAAFERLEATPTPSAELVMGNIEFGADWLKHQTDEKTIAAGRRRLQHLQQELVAAMGEEEEGGPQAETRRQWNEMWTGFAYALMHYRALVAEAYRRGLMPNLSDEIQDEWAERGGV